jgi:hypothetical protein
MGTKITTGDGSREVAVADHGDGPLRTYISQLKKDYGRYALSVDEARLIVDESMGATSLTALLYKSREDGGAK